MRSNDEIDLRTILSTMLPCGERWKVQISADLPESVDLVTNWRTELASSLAFIERSHNAVWHGVDFDDCWSNALQWPK